MSVEFSNAYQEILLDNLVAVIKQNFVFQTQLKLTENAGNEKNDLQERLNTLQSEFDTISNQARDVEIYKSRAEQNSSAHEEKSRIQTALNDTMAENSRLKNQVEANQNEIRELRNQKESESKLFSDQKKAELNNLAEGKDNEIAELKDYIKILEENVAVSKLKKINPTLAKTLEVPVVPEPVVLKKSEPTISTFTEKTDDGSAF
jgi:chromosome segregation ATPase